MKIWEDATFDERNDIVFSGRNKAFGAYELRKKYNITVTYIIGGVLAFSIILTGAKKLIDNRSNEAELTQDMSNIVVDLTPPPPAEELPPPPPPPPPPPMVEMLKFVPPVIKDDAVEEEPQKLHEEVKDVNVGEKDQEGDKDIIAPPVEEGPTETVQEILTVVEEMPEPPGGIQAFYQYVAKSIQYPSMAREAGLQGKVFLKFVVEIDGSIGDVQVLKGVPGCSDCDKEAIRVIKQYPNKWKPGRNNGRAARVYYNLPVVFKIS
ncbi:MAG: energy transducer TonB [Bacteroidia bacterium]